MKFKEHVDMYEVPMIKKHKEKKLNPKTNRMKTRRSTIYHKTNIPPEKRTFKNLPRYSNDMPKVRFQDWLLIKKGELHGSTVDSIGKSEADGKWYGWSHRAVYGFKKGDKITAKDYIGRDFIKKEPPFTIGNEKEAKEMAIAFAKEIS
jgi:hypothetical protein